MTEEELYKYATKKMEITLRGIERKDPFLYQELFNIQNIIDKLLPISFKDKLNGPLPSCTKEETILLVEEFLRKCNKHYAKKFLEDYKKGRIILGKDERTCCMNFVKNGNIYYEVHINESGTLKDAMHLIHEYFHALNLNRSNFRKAMTECISITAELLFLDFLKEKGISEYDIALLSSERKYFFLNNYTYLEILLPLYTEVAEKGKIDEETYSEIMKEKITKKTYVEFLTREIVDCSDTEREENIEIYRHIFGYIYASNFHHRELSIKKLAIANNALRDQKGKKFSKVMDDSIFENVSNFILKKEMDRYIPKQYTK